MELLQSPSMMDKQVKVSQAKSEKRMEEVAESPSSEISPVLTQPSQTIEGKVLIWFGCIYCV